MIVADSNLIAYLLLPSPKNEIAEKALRIDSEWSAPLLWRSEFRNILALYMRKYEMTVAQAQTTMDKAESIFNGREYSVSSDSVIELVSRTQLSAYDAEFGVLASELNVPLVTLDKLLLREMEGIAISLDSFVKNKG